MCILSINNISRYVKKTPIYEDISIKVNEGDCYAVIGEDDAGKTSIIHAALGISSVDKGHIMWLGKEQKRAFPRDVAYVPDDLICFENMTGAEFLDMAIKLCGREDAIEEAERLIEYFCVEPSLLLEEMDEDMNKCTYLISGFLKKSCIMVLDEPFNFLGEESRKKLSAIIDIYVRQGNTVIITSDNYDDVADVCTRFSAIKRGKQIRRDEESAWYSAAKLVKLHGADEKTVEWLGNMNGFVQAKTEETKDVFVYTGKIEELKQILLSVQCTDFTVEDLGIQEQIFMDYAWLNGLSRE